MGETKSRLVKHLNRNQLIRMREIFAPFFKVLNDYCTSYSIYRCKIEGETLCDESRVNFDFVVSGENGRVKVDSLVYSVERDDVFFPDKFKFQKGRENDVVRAIKKLLYDLNSIDTLLSKILVENGTRWVMGTIGEDIGEDGTVYEGYIIFLKSDLAFEEYALTMDDDYVELY